MVQIRPEAEKGVRKVLKTPRGQSLQFSKVSRGPKTVLLTVVVVVILAIFEDGGRRDHQLMVSGARLAADDLRDGDADLETDQEQPMMLDGSAQSLAIATSGGIQCETINVAPCKQRMLYNLTTMPNFFDDLTQAEAHTRAKQYHSLLDSTCNQFMSTYLCQLITPVCLDQDLEAMYKFKIYPCRTFCRRMLTDCGAEIDAHRRLLATHLLADPGGFDCDRLPYEANGGNLSSALYGPCHDPFMDEQQQQQPDSKSNQNQFRPFEREKDIFIAETSPLDIFSHIQPSAGASNSNSNNNHNHKQSKTATSTVAPPVGAPTPNPPTQHQHQHHHQHQQQPSWWHQIGLFGQSVITNLVKYSNVISIFTVLVLLAALNIKRLRRLERFYASTSSASSSSSSSAGSSAPLNAGGGSLGKGASPKSAALASLSGNSSLAPTSTTAPTNAGYHSALARQQQIYTNILLSSPSHQVLLLNDSSAQTGARSKLLSRGELLASPAHHHQPKHSRAPQTRAPPLPPPPPLFESAPAASNYNYLSGSDQQSSSGYYEPAPVAGARHSPYASSSMSPATSAATYDAPISHLSAAGDSLRRSSFRRHQQHPLKVSATPTKPAQQQHPNLGLFMGP